MRNTTTNNIYPVSDLFVRSVEPLFGRVEMYDFWNNYYTATISGKDCRITNCMSAQYIDVEHGYVQNGKLSPNNAIVRACKHAIFFIRKAIPEQDQNRIFTMPIGIVRNSNNASVEVFFCGDNKIATKITNSVCLIDNFFCYSDPPFKKHLGCNDIKKAPVHIVSYTDDRHKLIAKINLLIDGKPTEFVISEHGAAIRNNNSIYWHNEYKRYTPISSIDEAKAVLELCLPGHEFSTTASIHELSVPVI
jgi:hypothetical protein